MKDKRPVRSKWLCAIVRRLYLGQAKPLLNPAEVVHGDRMATVIDPFGNQWTVASRIEQISVEKLHRRLAQ